MLKYKPEVFVAPSPDAQASGQPMMVFAELAQYPEFAAILDTNGLTHIDANSWYPMQSALNVFRAFFEHPNSPNYDLVKIGMNAMQTFSLPFEVHTIEDILGIFDQIAKAFSRNVPEDFGFPLEIVGSRHALITNNTPIPYSAVYGFIWNILNNYKPSDENILIRPLSTEENEPTLFDIQWGPSDIE